MSCVPCPHEQVKILEGESVQLKQELRELQARVCQEEQKEEEARREAFMLRQRVLEGDADREAALNKVTEGLQDLVWSQHLKAHLRVYEENICHARQKRQKICKLCETVLACWECYFKVFVKYNKRVSSRLTRNYRSRNVFVLKNNVVKYKFKLSWLELCSTCNVAPFCLKTQNKPNKNVHVSSNSRLRIKSVSVSLNSKRLYIIQEIHACIVEKVRLAFCLVCVFAQVAHLQKRVAELETVETQNRELLQDREAYQQQCDQRHRETAAQLGEALEDARTQVKELTVQVGLTEGKVHGLEGQLDQADAKRRELELKLGGLCSALRCTVGTGQARLLGTSGSPRRSPSSWRKHSQVKGRLVPRQHDAFLFARRCVSICLCLGGDGSVLSVSRGGDEELDVDSVVTALREFQQELRNAQRERVFLNSLIAEDDLKHTNKQTLQF